MAKKFKHLREELNDKQKEQVNDLFSEPRIAERITGHVPGFVNHRQVIPFSDTHDVIITRHPHDVAGKSCHDNITSCMTWGHDTKPHMPSDIFDDLVHGTHEAYLVPKGAHDKPIGRISLKPFRGYDSNNDDTGHTILRPEKKVYGTNINSSLQDKFKDTVRNWAHTHMPYHPGTMYVKHPNVYSDDGIDKKGHTEELWRRGEFNHVLNDTSEHRTEDIPIHDVLTNPNYKLHTKVAVLKMRPSDESINTVLSTYGENPGLDADVLHTALTTGKNISRKKLQHLSDIHKGRNKEVTSSIGRAILNSSSYTQKEKESAYEMLSPAGALQAMDNKRSAHPNLMTHMLKRYRGEVWHLTTALLHANKHGVLTDEHIEEYKKVVPGGEKTIAGLQNVSNKTVLGRAIDRMNAPISEEAPVNSTAGAGEGMGDSPATFMSKKAQKRHVEDPNRILRRRVVEGVFAGKKTFKLTREDYADLMNTPGKEPYHHWERYLKGKEWANQIREYANKNPKEPIIVECSATGHMTHLRYGKK